MKLKSGQICGNDWYADDLQSANIMTGTSSWETASLCLSAAPYEVQGNCRDSETVSVSALVTSLNGRDNVTFFALHQAAGGTALHSPSHNTMKLVDVGHGKEKEFLRNKKREAARSPNR